MKNALCFWATFSIFFYPSFYCFAEPITIKSGLWEVCGQTVIAYQVSSKECHLECFQEFNGDRIFFPSEDGHVLSFDSSRECEVSEYTRNGKQVNWKATCSRDVFPFLGGSFQYEDESYTVSMSASTKNKNSFSTIFNGRFLTSDCNKRDSAEVLNQINPAEHDLINNN